MRALAAAAALGLAGAACLPDVDERLSVVDAPRVLAVVSEPAEAAPGDEVGHRVHVAGPDGPIDASAASWAYCTAPKPATEDNAVSAACLGDEASIALGDGAAIDAVMPDDACLLYGPDTPPGGFRPRDPDATGGYYQPVRVELGGEVAFGMHRVRCNLDGVPLAIARDFRDRYVADRNPAAPVVAARADGAPLDLGAPIPAGSRVDLLASWPADDAEAFLALDRATQTLVDRREAIRISWFATAGALAVDSSGRPEDDPVTAAANLWEAPAEPGTVHLWAVIRDSRGGSAVWHRAVTVEP
jgi:hypothetical protein